MLIVTNRQGRKFHVTIVREGGAYGREKCLTHGEADPLVEFYDATYAGDERFDAEGQFVSRYYASTLLEGEVTGLCLDGGVDAWQIEEACMALVRAFVMGAVA